MTRNTRSIETRFWEKVDRRGQDECWFWKGKPGPNGYGRMNVNGRDVGAHRISFLLNVGEIQPGYSVCHTCDVRICVNPRHLFQGTTTDNMRDMTEKGHNFFQKGHLLTVGSRNGRSKLSEDDVEFIRRNYDRFSCLELSERFGVSESAIHRTIQGRNWSKVDVEPIKRRPGQSKLTMQQVEEICGKIDGSTLSALAREYGITPSGIRYVVQKYKE